MESVAEFLAAVSFNRESGQTDSRLFTQLDEGQSHICVPVQVLARDLIENGDAAEVITPFKKQAHERADAIRRSHRIAECCPRSALDAIHDERRLFFVEENCLVAEPQEVRQ